MAIFEMSKYAPYRSVGEYRNLRPNYVFEGRTAEEWVAGTILKCLEKTEGETLAECGCGPGPLWDLLPSDLKILAVEPNKELWPPNCPPQVHYLEQDGFDFLTSHPDKLDVISWMWAINYPLLSFFEHYDPIQKSVHLEDWLAGHHQCLDRFISILNRRQDSNWVVLFFDGESAEQSFVTRVWEEVAPFPFNDRSHTRKILEMAFQYVASRTGCRLEKAHLEGIAEYGSLDQAVEKMMNFHLRGNFFDQEKTRLRVREFLSPYQVNRQVQCPAAAYIYQFKPSC